MKEEHVSRALALVLADDRRKPENEEATQRLWRDAFRLVPHGQLEKAVQRWLEDHRRGRPNVGEIKATLQELYPEAAAAPESKWQDEKRAELEWACRILEQPGHYQHQNYRHTVDYAEKCLKHHQFTSWESAREWLSPGWTPTGTWTETI